MDENIIVVFEENEPKKHSIRYNCKDENPAVSSIYISRAALAKIGTPDKVAIIIKAVGPEQKAE